MPPKGGKGTVWTPELERRMLIIAITAADLKPSTATWNMVAQALGNGLTASAVSQKFTKLKKATTENDGGITALPASPSVSTPPAAASKTKNKPTPAAAGRKRKAESAPTEVSDAPKKKKAQQVKKEPEDVDEARAIDSEADSETQDGHPTNGEKVADAGGSAEDEQGIDSGSGDVDTPSPPDGKENDVEDEANCAKTQEGADNKGGREQANRKA